MRTVHHYSDAEKARALGRALVVGPLRASKELNIPEATIAGWRRKFPDGIDEYAVSREAVTAELWSTFTDSIERIKEMIHYPKVRLGDVVKAADSLRDSHALLTGAATARTESTSVNYNVPEGSPLVDLTYEERADLRRYIAAIPDPELLTEGDPDA